MTDCAIATILTVSIDKLPRQDYIKVPNIENGKEDTNVNRREQGLGWPLA